MIFVLVSCFAQMCGLLLQRREDASQGRDESWCVNCNKWKKGLVEGRNE